MNFKEQVKADIDSVFLNFDEFGEYHVIEGKKVLCIIDDDKLAEINLGKKLGSQMLELVEADILLFAREDNLPENLTPGSQLTFDSKEMIIQHSSVSMGIAELALSQNRMY